MRLLGLNNKKTHEEIILRGNIGAGGRTRVLAHCTRVPRVPAVISERFKLFMVLPTCTAV